MAVKKKPAPRKFIDWDSIEPLYRAGGLPLHGICDQYESDHINSQVWKKTVTHAAILKHAKVKGWTRNLAGKVQERIKEKLVTKLVTDCNLSEEEIVDKASESGVNVVMMHREQIKGLEDIEDHLLDNLACGSGKVHVGSYRGKAIITKLNLTVTEKTIAYKNLTGAMTQRIALERQAHNIDNGNQGDDPIKSLKDDQLTERIKLFEAKVNK